MKIEMIEQSDFNPETQIRVIGVGGGGGNAVEHMITSGVRGVEFICANTDAQALKVSSASRVIQLGDSGLGAGSKPERGQAAAEAAVDSIREVLQGANMVFITAGMGGGTGTGGASVVAQIARELGALTVAVVTKPFGFEGKRRRKHADIGISRLRECVDTIITIPNERLLSIIDRSTPMTEAFVTADDVLRQAIQGISDLILVPGLINLDFADVKAIMSGMGVAMMGTGVAEGEGRALAAARAAISSPLLEDSRVEGARGVIINVTGGPDLGLMEVGEASAVIQEAAHEDANIIFGAVVDPNLVGRVKITVIATGFDGIGRAATSKYVTPTEFSGWEVESKRIAAAAHEGVEPAAREAAGMPVVITSRAMPAIAPQFQVERRPAFEMALPLAAPDPDADALRLEDIDLSLDVPAFLRQK
ncbi:MAG: cell division protein FtsZ [Burkholderiales bacterium]|nr:cell division protein FtsZ [Burkholderiales bacterium]